MSKTLTTATDDQVDLLYSLVSVTKTAEEAKADSYAPVPLTMDHLFAAVTINVKNCTDKDITITDISKIAIPNAGSATVDFSLPDTAKVTYGTVSVSGDFVTADALEEGNLTLAAQNYYDVLTMATATEKAYQLVWPQTIAANALSLTVGYKDNDGEPHSTLVSLPAGEWKAGHKYDYTLQVLPSGIKLTFIVVDWEGIKKDIDSELGSINMSNVTWQNARVTQDTTATPIVWQNTLKNDAYSVDMLHNASIQVVKRDSNGDPIHQVYTEETVGLDGETHAAGTPVVDEYGNPTVYEMVWKEYDYYPAQGYFTVNYPKSGKYRIGLIPAYGETTVDTTKYEIYIYDLDAKDWKVHNKAAGENISNKTVYFQVRASESVPETHPQYKAQIDIWFKAEGSNEWISAYSEIRANYACIIPAVN